MCASTHLMLLSPASQYGKEKKKKENKQLRLFLL